MVPVSWLFLGIAALCFAVVGLSFWRGTTIGIAWRGNWIARRDREPKLFGCSVAIFATLGAFLMYVVFTSL